MQKCHATLSDSDRQELSSLLHQSDLRSKVFKRVTALPELDKGRTIAAVQDALGLCYPTVAKLVRTYKAGGLGCLADKKQSGRPAHIDGKQSALITALACIEAPDGYARWSLRLLADKVVELGYCGEDGISHVQVGRILKKMK